MFKAIFNHRAALSVHYPAFHDAVSLPDTSRCERDGLLTVVTRPDANGVRIGIQDPLEDAAFSMPAVGMDATQEEPRTWAQVPTPSVGIPSAWASAVPRRTGGSCSSSLCGLPLLGHQRVPPHSSFLAASPVTLAMSAPIFGAGRDTPGVSAVARVATANRVPLPPPVPDSLFLDTSATHGSEGEALLEPLVGRLCGPSDVFPLSELLVSVVNLL